MAQRGNRPQPRNIRLNCECVRPGILFPVQIVFEFVLAVMVRLLNESEFLLSALSSAVYCSSADPLLFEGLTTVMILLCPILSETLPSILPLLNVPCVSLTPTIEPATTTA